VYVRTADSGNQIRFHFCAECGATVYCRPGNNPDVIAVPVGAFADPEFPPPRVSVYESSRVGVTPAHCTFCLGRIFLRAAARVVLQGGGQAIRRLRRGDGAEVAQDESPLAV
jgi:hypothetical protein